MYNTYHTVYVFAVLYVCIKVFSLLFRLKINHMMENKNMHGLSGRKQLVLDNFQVQLMQLTLEVVLACGD